MLLSDCIISSAVLAADRGALIPDELREGADTGGAGGSGGGGGDFEFGVDPSLDPELAMVSTFSRGRCDFRLTEYALSGSTTINARSASS